VKAFGTLLGGAALPCALFALGAALVGRPIATGRGEVALLVGLKLLVHPLAVWVMVTHAFALQPLWARVAVIEAALPTAANVFVLAQRYDVYVDRASAIVFTSTLVSVATVSVLLALAVGR
jgi:malonate transporter